MALVDCSNFDGILNPAVEFWSRPQLMGREQIWLRKQAVLYSIIFESMPGLNEEQREAALRGFLSFVDKAMVELERASIYRLATVLEQSRNRRDSRESVKGLCRPLIRRQGIRAAEEAPELDMDYESFIIDLHLKLLSEVPQVDLFSFRGILPDPLRQNAFGTSLRIASRYTDLFDHRSVDQAQRQLECLPLMSTDDLAYWANALISLQTQADDLSEKYNVEFGRTFAPILSMVNVLITEPQRARRMIDGLIQLSESNEFLEISLSLARTFASPEYMNFIKRTCIRPGSRAVLYNFQPGCDIVVLRHSIGQLAHTLTLNLVSVPNMIETFRKFARLVNWVVMHSSDETIEEVKTDTLGKLVKSIAQYSLGYTEQDALHNTLDSLALRIQTETGFGRDHTLSYPKINFGESIESGVDVSLRQALQEFALFYGSGLFGIGDAVLGAATESFPSLNVYAKMALQRFLRDAVGGYRGSTEPLEILMDISFGLSSRYGIKIWQRLAGDEAFIHLRSIVSLWVFNGDFDEHLRDRISGMLAYHDLRSDGSFDTQFFEAIAGAIKTYTLARKDFEVAEYTIPGNFILMRIWERPKSAIAWLNAYQQRLVSGPVRAALQIALRGDFQGIGNHVVSYTDPLPYTLVENLIHRIPLIYRSRIAKIAGWMEHEKMFHPKYFFKFGLNLSNYMMAWLSITGLFDTGKELLDQVTLFMDTWQRVIESIPLTGTAEEARHWNQKLGTGRAYIDTLRLFIMDGKPRIELIAKFEEIRKGLESCFL